MQLSATLQRSHRPAHPAVASPWVRHVRRWRILAIVWLFAGWYGYTGLDRGWVPHDEGQFAQAADRILAGEMPHRDFDEMYTGGLSYLNAAAFRASDNRRGYSGSDKATAPWTQVFS